MDKERKHAPSQGGHDGDTIRHDAATGQKGVREGSVHRQGSFDMEKLRRDLEASKRLHDEARQQKQAQQQSVKGAQSPEGTRPSAAAARKQEAQPATTEKRAAQDVRAMPAYREAQEKKNAQRANDVQGAHSTQEARSTQRAHGSKAKAAAAALAARAKKGKKEKTNRTPLYKRKGCGCLFYLILFFVVIGVAFAALWMVRAHNAPTPIDQIPEADRAAVAMEREKSNVYLLLAGTDQRADEASRSDTIIYAALRPVDRKIEMVSIPRDSLVEIPGVGEDKINASLAYGGMALLQETVEDLLNNPVDHTVLLNFDSFANIIDAMGGITINVEEDMYLPEEGIDLKAGEQKLNGHDALAFVRWRGDGTGDIGRMQRQSQFMQALSEKVRHLTPWRAVMTMWAVGHEVETDMSGLDMLKLAWSFIGMSGDALEYQTFEYETPYINGISYVLLNDQSVNDVVQTMKYGMVIDGTGTGYDDSDGYYY